MENSKESKNLKDPKYNEKDRLIVEEGIHFVLIK